MLFEFSRVFTSPNCIPTHDVCLITDLDFHDGVLEATLVSDQKAEYLGTKYYVRNKETKKFYASGSYVIVEYTGEISDNYR